MLEKILGFLVKVALASLFSFLLTIPLSFVLAILFNLAMIPIRIIVGENIAHAVSSFSDGIAFRLVFSLIFVSILFEGANLSNIKTKIKSWVNSW